MGKIFFCLTLFISFTLSFGEKEDAESVLYTSKALDYTLKNNDKDNGWNKGIPINKLVRGYEKDIQDYYESEKGKNGDNDFNNEEKTVDNDFNLANTMNGNDTIIRPCPGYDIYCIRKHFTYHGKCKPVEGSVSEPYFRAQTNYFFANFNLSVTSIGIYYRGFQGIVEDLFLNNQTDQAVLTIRFRNFRFNTTQDIFRYHRVAKEPAIRKSVSAVFFPSLTTTTIFRGIDSLDLTRSETTSFLDAMPTVIIDPSAGVHPDPVVSTTFAAFVSDIVTAVLEGELTDASFTAATFIQHAICDFGLYIL